MTSKAWLYVGMIYLFGVVLLVFSILIFVPNSQQVPTFIVLTGLATLAQLFKSEAPSHQVYHPALIFAFSGVLLLDTFLFAVLIIVSHLIEWIKEKLTSQGPHLRAWYIQPFNIAMHIIIGFCAQVVFKSINPVPPTLISNLAIVAALIAALTYVLLNHLMVGLVIGFARGISLKESGIFNVKNLTTDYVMFTMGYVFAILYQFNPWLILPTLTPLYLVYRALAVPQLIQKANTDSKTGVWNAEYFSKSLEVELRRAKRFNHPLTVIMADIDLLRNINNTYGHLGGDAVLIGVADILKKNFREFDVVSRFGGEEFAILLPETEPSYAIQHIESIRSIVEEAVFVAPTTKTKIKATMSFGISGKNGSDLTATEIVHQADVAVYHAKLQGRNRISVYSDEIANILDVQ